MKSIVWLTTCLIMLQLSTAAQTLFTYGNKPVGREEFVKAFLKNNENRKFTEKDYRDYLELYIRYKLKVQAALDLKLDTLPSQRSDNNDFRNQVITEYLNDQASFDRLVKEAFVRSQKDIHVGHVFISNRTQFGSEGSRSVRPKADSIYTLLQKGADFKETAARLSSDTTARSNGGDLGWITAFTLPYEMENIVYSLSPGKISPVFASSMGYHIFKNFGERKAAGQVLTAQILLAFPPDADAAARKKVQQRADSVYRQLQKGASFPDLVNKYSDDRTTKANGGELPPFGPGTYDPPFDSSVFALAAPGAYTRPVRTDFGYHIVRLLEQIPVNGDSNNQEAMAALKQRVQTDPRMEVARQAARAGMYNRTGYAKAPVAETSLRAYTDSALRGTTYSGITANTVLFSFGKEAVTAGDWISYVQAAGGQAVLRDPAAWATLMKQFTETRMEKYYRDQLEDYNPAFAAQMKEVKEGNLYFEIMQRNVWQKAAADSAGLLQYYGQHKDRYWWEASAGATLFTCRDSATAYALRAKLEKAPKAWRKITGSYGDAVQADSGRFELTQLPVKKTSMLQAGSFTAPVKGSPENPAYTFAYVSRIFPNRSPRNFNDSKGFVLNDYQSYLEDNWIATLKTRYPVKVDETVLRLLW